MKKLVVISLFLASINLIYAENTSVPTTVALKKIIENQEMLQRR